VISKRTRILVQFIFIFALLIVIAQSSHALTLVKNGKPQAVIVIDAQAADSVKLAANELQSYIQKVSGAQLPILTDTSTISPSQALIFVGESAGTRERGFVSTDLKPDGYHTTITKQWIAILGHDYNGTPVYGYCNPWQYNEVYNPKLKLGAFGEAGTLYGVYHFLEDACGIRWYMHGKLGEVVPSKKTITFPEGKLDQSPDFGYRYPWFCDFDLAPDEALWYRRTGFGSPAPVQIMHSFDLLLTAHPEYKETHPEYFALIGGQRDFTNLSTMIGNGNLCLSNPDVAKEWIAYICDYFAKHPEHKVFPVAPNDGMVKICECDKCQAQISPELGPSGKFSNYVWKFVDTVARGVGEKYPDHLVGCIAYSNYNAPPSNIEHLSPNVAVMICKSRGSYTDPTYHQRIQKATNDWHKKATNLYFWEYYLYSWPPWRALPVAFPHIIANDLKSLKGISKGEFIESESVMPGGAKPGDPWGHINYPGMAHLNLYVTAKCLWNADTDVDKLLDEYFTLFYGPAKKDMQKFWTETETICNKHTGGYPINILTSARIQSLNTCLEQAKLHTIKGSLYRQRVELIESEFAKGRAKMFGTENRKLPELVIKPSASIVHLDGNLRQPVWKDSESIGLINKDGSPSDISTLVFAASDPEALLFTFIMNEPDMSKLQARCTKRDQMTKPGMWEDDSVEIFLSPSAADRRDCFQFVINSKGVLLNLHRTDIAEGKNDYKWNSHTQTKAWQEANRWILQVRIPFKDLGITQPYAGKKLSANFYRNRYCGTSENQTCWSPISSTPKYSPNLFGTITLGGN